MSRYLASESGAVTVDWVVLTAGLVGLGLATMAVVSTGVQDTSGDIENQLSANDIVATGFRTDSNLEYGLYGAETWNDARTQIAIQTFAGYDGDQLRAAYTTAQGNVQGVVDGGGWGPYAAQQYHDLHQAAVQLQELGEPLPDDAKLASEFIADRKAIAGW